MPGKPRSGHGMRPGAEARRDRVAGTRRRKAGGPVRRGRGGIRAGGGGDRARPGRGDHPRVRRVGASTVLRGGVVSYASAVKTRVLGVPAGLLAARGAVDPDVARAMAVGAARVLDADLAVATTGVAGPDPADGRPVGRVYVAVNRAGPVRELDLPGDRWQVRAAAATAALESLRDTLARC